MSSVDLWDLHYINKQALIIKGMNRNQCYFLVLCWIFIEVECVGGSQHPLRLMRREPLKHITHVSTHIPFLRDRYSDMFKSMHTARLVASKLCVIENATNMRETCLYGETYYSISYDYQLMNKSHGKLQMYTNHCDESKMLFVTDDADVLTMLKLRLPSKNEPSSVHVDANVLRDEEGLQLVNILLRGLQQYADLPTRMNPNFDINDELYSKNVALLPNFGSTTTPESPYWFK